MDAPLGRVELVDALGYGWARIPGTPTLWETRPNLWGPYTIDQLQSRGPLRDVVPAEPREIRDLVGLFVAAGDLAVGSLARALHIAYAAHRVYLTAGSPDSSASAALALLYQVVGEPMSLGNLGVFRYDRYTSAAMKGALLGWTMEEHEYTEVPLTLACVFGQVVDQRQGWGNVCTPAIRASAAGTAVREWLTAYALVPAAG